MTSRSLALLLAGTMLSAFSAPVVAGDDIVTVPVILEGDLPPYGDGSATNNPDLLRGAYECGSNCPSSAVPREAFNPPFDVDWSVLLRGSYVQQDGVGRYETSIVPALTLTHEGLRSSLTLDAEAEITRPQDTVARIAALRLAAASEYGLDSVTNFATEGELTVEQAAPSDPSNLTGTAVSPRVGNGDLAATLTRDIGIAYVGLRGTVGRTVYGETTFADGTVTDNSASNNTRYGAGLRLSRRLTPIIGAFVDASATAQVYDAVSPALLVKLDGTDYVLRGGLTAERGETLEFEGSVGVALRRFADTSLADVRAALYDASVTFRPTETLTLIAGVGSSVAAPGPTGDGYASIEHTFDAEAQYTVNSWWSLRGFVSAYRATAVGAPYAETGVSVGAGSAYQVNQLVALTADYSFSRLAVDGAVPIDTHRASLGVKVSR